MALLDHFHPPLSIRRHWHSFHNAWATYIASELNSKLPEGYFAEQNVQFGIEIDIAAFEETPLFGKPPNRNGIAPVLATAGWAAPAPSQTLPFQPTTDTAEIRIFSSEAGPTLVSAIELVSPANKACPELDERNWRTHRDTFVSKCETYLRQGVGLVILDIVTNRRANLHNELLTRLIGPDTPHLNASLYAVAYRPVERNEQPTVEIWPEKLVLGESLPTIPLWLRGSLSLPLELNTTYERTCREQRIHS